jgi:hypothetical protein
MTNDAWHYLLSFLWQFFDNCLQLLTYFWQLLTIFWQFFDYVWQLIWQLFDNSLFIFLTMWHYNSFVTPQVFQFIGPSNDGRRHGRGTYLFLIVFNRTRVCLISAKIVFECRSRTRRFFNRMGRKKCPHVDTMEKAPCAGMISPVCPSNDGGDDDGGDPHCAVTSWSDWSPCSVSCGNNSLFYKDKVMCKCDLHRTYRAGLSRNSVIYKPYPKFLT